MKILQEMKSNGQITNNRLFVYQRNLLIWKMLIGFVIAMIKDIVFNNFSCKMIFKTYFAK